MGKEPASHLKALMYLSEFVGRPAPRNSQIMEASGVLTSSSDAIFKRLVRSQFLKIERRGSLRRFVFSNGSSTDWGDNIKGQIPASWKGAHYSDISAKRDIEKYWSKQGKDVLVVIVSAGKVRAFNPDGTPLSFSMSVDTGHKVSRETVGANA